jgi:phosphoadenosine phosphosulfate reductase
MARTSDPTVIDETRRLLAAIEQDHAPAAFASSFGAEDMVLLDLLASDARRIPAFTLDTGRLPRETHDLIERARARYGVAIEIVRPLPQAVEGYVAAHGIDGFYEGIAQRRACCEVRKVEPLRRALAGQRSWITGLRRAQSEGRQELAAASFDIATRVWKFNPLVEWGDEDVWSYLREHDVPYNVLHDRGYPSIGCEPCTRAVKPGEHPRAGRWWWESEAVRKECGLHAIALREVSA